MIRRAPTIAPLARQLIPQHEPITPNVELPRDAPERRARAVVPLAHALLPVRPTRARAALLARVEQRAEALFDRAEVGGLGERGRVPGLERVEVRFERVVVGEKTGGV